MARDVHRSSADERMNPGQQLRWHAARIFWQLLICAAYANGHTLSQIRVEMYINIYNIHTYVHIYTIIIIVFAAKSANKQPAARQVLKMKSTVFAFVFGFVFLGQKAQRSDIYYVYYAYAPSC